MNRIVTSIKNAIVFTLVGCLLGPIPTSAFELPEEILLEREAVRHAVQTNRDLAHFDTRSMPGRESRSLIWVPTPGVWKPVDKDNVQINTSLGMLDYKIESEGTYIIKADQKLSAIKKEPVFVEPKLFDNAEGLPGYREPPDIRWDIDWFNIYPLGATIGLVLGTLLVAATHDPDNDTSMATGTLGFSTGIGIGFLVDYIGRENSWKRNREVKAENKNLLEAENQKLMQEARRRHNSELSRVRDENKRIVAQNVQKAIEIYALTSGEVDIIWYGDPRLSF